MIFKKEFISGEEVKKNLGIATADLRYLILKGLLVAHTENFEPFTKEDFLEMVSGPYAYLTSDWPEAGYDGFYFLVEEVQKIGVADDNSTKKLRRNQRHRIECRKVAEIIWKNNPSLTIVDMIGREEILLACEHESYDDKTMREWLKDLCPNRLPGRRPTAK